MEACDCSKTDGPRCPRCVSAIVAQLSGVAYNRGWFKAELVAGAEIGKPWKSSRQQALANAVELLRDLHGDVGVLEALAPQSARAPAIGGEAAASSAA